MGKSAFGKPEEGSRQHEIIRQKQLRVERECSKNQPRNLTSEKFHEAMREEAMHILREKSPSPQELLKKWDERIKRRRKKFLKGGSKRRF